MQVRELRPAEYPAWDRYVQEHPHGTPFHLIAWKKTIEAGFPYRPMYLAVFDGDRIEGVLPLFYVSSLLTGKALISSPFAVYGGALVSSEEARDALRSFLEERARQLGVDYVELRNRYPEQAFGFSAVTRYVTFTQQVSPDEEAILESIPRKTRYMVRKALKHPFETRVAADPSAFRDLYSANLRRLGTPCFPSVHFDALLENFRGSADVREVILNGKVVAAVLTLFFRDQALPYYGASDPAFNEFAPNNFMYFDLMRWSGQHGYRLYDFGRSKKISGSFDFKAHWGMEMLDLPYEILLVRRKTLPDYNPNNPKLQWAIKLWQRVPLQVTRVIGPRLLRLVP